MSFRRGFKADADRIAIRIREQLGLTATEPVDPFVICKHFDIQVIRLSDLDPDSHFLGAGQSLFSAVTVPRGLDIAIVHNDAHHPYRQNSNVCHELAHCFLGHECSPPLTEEGERARKSGLEAEANFLAGSILIPNAAALHILKAGLGPEAQEHYGVSNAMLHYRLRVSGAEKIYRRINKAMHR